MGRQSKLIVIITLSLVLILYGTCFAEVKKWINKEVLPYVSMQHPTRIDPSRITITSKGKKVFEVSGNKAYLRISKVTAQTHQLDLRLAQATCVYVTGGNFYECAPDIINREMGNLLRQIENAAEEEANLDQSKEQKMMADVRCRAAVMNARRTDRLFSDLHNNSIFQISANLGWQPISLPAPSTRVKILSRNWSTGKNSKKFIEDYPVDSLLVFIDDLGATAITDADEDGYFVFPFTVHKLQLRINDSSLYDNSGSISVKFDNKSDDIPFICPGIF